MTYTAPKTFDDRIRMMATFVQRIVVSRRAPAVVNLPASDARFVHLAGMAEVVSGFAITVAAIIAGRPTRESAEEAFLHAGVARVTGDVVVPISREEAMLWADNVWRWSILTMCHFKLDSLLRDLTQALTGKAEGPFHRNATMLTKSVTLKRHQQEAHATLMLCAHMRNTLHNNGTHTTPRQISVPLGDFSYVFDPGEKVNCMSWEQIFTALTAALDVVDEILASPEISALAACPPT